MKIRIVSSGLFLYHERKCPNSPPVGTVSGINPLWGEYTFKPRLRGSCAYKVRAASPDGRRAFQARTQVRAPTRFVLRLSYFLRHQLVLP